MRNGHRPIVLGKGAVDKLLDAEKPWAEESEKRVLGSMLIDQECIDEVVEIVPSGKAFFDDAHGMIFDEIVRMHGEGPIDMTVLLQRLSDMGVLESIGGASVLATIAGDTISSATVGWHAAQVRDKAKRRAIAECAVRILKDANDTQTDGGTLIDRAESSILAVGESGVQFESTPISDAVSECLALTERRQAGETAAIPTGISSLDAIITGLRAKEVTIVAGRPSMGKSAAAFQIALSVASRGYPVEIFSMEMDKTSITARLLCCESRVYLNHILNPAKHNLDNDAWRRLYDAGNRIAEMPLEVCECAGITVGQLRAMARRAVRRRKVAVILIDYLQLLSCPGKETSREEVSAISGEIKRMAMETGTAVLCVAQLNRASESGHVRRPRMSDLQESGKIEQDADTIILLHREAYYHKHDSDWEIENQAIADRADLIVDKQRNGQTGVAYAWWSGPTQTFRSEKRATA